MAAEAATLHPEIPRYCGIGWPLAVCSTTGITGDGSAFVSA
jgi:hypothetical protein